MKNFTKILSVLTGIIINVNIGFSQAPTNGLVAYYPFNGITANDASGNNRHGAFSGGVSVTSDRYGNPNQAYYFNGIDGSIKIANWNILTGNSARTMSVWFKTTPPNFYRMMISWGAIGTDLGSNLGILCEGQNLPNSLGFTAIYNVGLTVANQNQYFDNIWHLITFTHDGTTMRLYLDGVQKAVSSNNTVINTASTNMVIGAYANNVGFSYYLGALDDVRIYNRALTPIEVQQMYLAEVAPSNTTDIVKLGTNKFIHTTGEANTFIGTNSGRNTSGANNTFLGNSAGGGIESGLGNIFIGSNANSFGSNSANLQRSGAVGYNARVSVNDAIVLGDFENPNIKIGIGVHDPQYRLDVKGVINMRTAYNSPGIKLNGKNFLELDNEGGFLVSNFKIKYNNVNEWADEVFEPNYKLHPIEEVAQYAKEHKHLPNVPAAEEVVKNGVEIQVIVAKLLKKIEELTLYLSEQNKINKDQMEEIKKLKIEVNRLKNSLSKE